MRSRSWQTSRKMATAQSRWSDQALLEKSRRRIMDGLRKSSAVDNYVVVKMGRSGERHEVQEGGKANTYNRLPRSCHSGRSGRAHVCVHTKREWSVLSSTPQMREINIGDHRSWTKTGTPSAWLFTRASRERHGRPCTTICVQLHEAVKCKNLVETKRPKALCSLKEAKDKGTDCL